jgi:hypothetical protein
MLLLVQPKTRRLNPVKHYRFDRAKLEKAPELPKILSGEMRGVEKLLLDLTEEEAWELLSRCLNSTEPDNEISREILRKLAKALQNAPIAAVSSAA